MTNPAQSVSELPLLTPAERHQLLVEWNDTQAEYPRERCVHQLFEEQAQRTPDAVAIVCNQQSLTYAQLNAKANQLAHYLQSLDVGSETRVGIALPRSAEMIVAALAVLKAGGAYVPIDLAYPLQRLRYLAENSGASVLLTRRAVPEGLNSQFIRTVPLESHWSKVAGVPEHCPGSTVSGSNLAYVIYTSGSTGKPKGVMVSHENVIASTHARAKTQIVLDRVFGAERREKASYLYREEVAPVAPLSWVALDQNKKLVGSIRYWPIQVGDAGSDFGSKWLSAESSAVGSG